MLIIVLNDFEDDLPGLQYLNAGKITYQLKLINSENNHRTQNNF